MVDYPVITIDGPSASGKGTIASKVAKRLGFHHLDSGQLYRMVAMETIKTNTNISDENKVIGIAHNVFASHDIVKERIEPLLNSEQVASVASAIAVFPRVRSILTQIQRLSRRYPGLVADGRDMGSVVFPDAILKIYLTADLHCRAERKTKQLHKKGISATMADTLVDIEKRDLRDKERAKAPLICPLGGVRVDSTDLTEEFVVEEVLEALRGILL